MKHLINNLTNIDNEKILLNHIIDKINLCNEYNFMQTTYFITEREQELIATLLNNTKIKYIFWGGYNYAKRKIFISYPEYIDDIYEYVSNDDPLSYLRILLPKGFSLKHSDYLGSIMSLGIKRNLIGDIITYSTGCDLICKNSISNYLIDNLEKAGRVKLNIKILENHKQLSQSMDNIIEKTITIPSLRLDSYISHTYNCSRNKANEYINKKLTSINGVECCKNDKLLKINDTVNLRGFGKTIIKDIIGNTRKGNLIINILFFN